MKSSNLLKFGISIMALFTLTGCVELLSFVCPAIGENAPHCYQWFAVQGDSPKTCEKVDPGDKFKPGAGNPPKDKCYLMIAEKTGDVRNCNSIKGGLLSYTKDECYEGAAEKAENPDLCDKAPDEVACRNKFASNNEHDCGEGFKFDQKTYTCKEDVKPEKERVIKDGEQDGTATFTKGEAFYRPQGSNTWFPMRADVKLKVGDTIRANPGAKVRYVMSGTGPNAGMKVVMGGSNVVIADPTDQGPQRSFNSYAADIYNELLNPKVIQNETVAGSR